MRNRPVEGVSITSSIIVIYMEKRKKKNETLLPLRSVSNARGTCMAASAQTLMLSTVVQLKMHEQDGGSR